MTDRSTFCLKVSQGIKSRITCTWSDLVSLYARQPESCLSLQSWDTRLIKLRHLARKVAPWDIICRVPVYPKVALTKMPDIIDQFLANYSRQQDYFQVLATRAAGLLSHRLKRQGVQVIVSSRAKDIDRLRDKLNKRRSKYKTEQDIYDDLLDLAGVRIALYFPGDIERVKNTIEELFDVLNTIEHPKPRKDDANKKEGSSYEPEFKGYKATHIIARIKAETLSEADKRYSADKVEIQIASIVMHAWAEVEHDIIYKQISGAPSVEEQMIIDEINGLVLAAELALKRLQRALEDRTSSRERHFDNHYELAAYLMRKFPDASSKLGRVDSLFDVCRKAGFDTAGSIDELVTDIDMPNETATVAERLLDKLFERNTDPGLIAFYKESRAFHDQATMQALSLDKDTQHGIFLFEFLKRWNTLEELLVKLTLDSISRRLDLTKLQKAGLFSDEDIKKLLNIRYHRNRLVHSDIELTPQEYRELIKHIAELIDKLHVQNS